MTTIWLVALFQVVDFAETLYALTYLGAVELNPVYGLLGPVGFWVLKGAMVVWPFAIWELARRAPPVARRWLTASFQFVCVALAGVTLHNAILMYIFLHRLWALP